MIVDDRLETVLRTVAAGPGAVATQLRQLIDLLDRTPAGRWHNAHSAALTRIDSLIAVLGEEPSARLIGAVGLRSPILVEHFAGAGPRVALAAITRARLASSDWLALIPDLPVQARGFLRHRRDLGPEVEALLARLGITDFALPLPAGFEPGVLPETLPGKAAAPQASSPADPPAPQPAELVPGGRPPLAAPTAGEGISAIIARIEAFRRAREAPSGLAAGSSVGSAPQLAGQPSLPFAEEPLPAPPPVSAVDLVLDADGTVIRADTMLAPAFVGLRPFVADPDAPVSCDPATLVAARARVPVIGGRLELEELAQGTASAAGAWRVDAVPAFASDGGHFTGWHVRLRRPPPAPTAVAPAAIDDDQSRRSADRLRQMLHELRTPINAIQGFAELIQQQLLGPTPHQYRSLAAGIASDAARMLAGFEDVERLAVLESAPPSASAHAIAPERTKVQTDLTALLTRLTLQLEPLLAPREAVLAHDLPDGPLPIAAAPEDLERTLWRLLSLVASAAMPGERICLSLRVGTGPQGFAVRLTLPLPAALAAPGESGPQIADGLVTPGGMLGSKFALRLSAAELRAVGGLMVQDGARLDVTLPLLTTAQQILSQTGGIGDQAV